MNKIYISLAICLALSVSAFSQKIRFVKEILQTNTIQHLETLHPQKYFFMSAEWERNPKQNTPIAVHYKLLDIPNKRVTTLTIPIADFFSKRSNIFKIWTAPALLYYNGEKVAMIYKIFSKKGVVEYFCEYNSVTKQFSELKEIGNHSNQDYIQPIDVDPEEKYFYYAYDIFSEGAPAKMKLYRIGLDDMNIDWEMVIPRPVPINKTLISYDGKKIALIEHIEKRYQSNPQVHVIDVADKKYTSFPATYSCYGMSFSRDNKYLVLGSNEVGEIKKINLESGETEFKVQAVKLIHRIITTPSGKYFFSFSENWRQEHKGPKIFEVRSWADLKLIKTIPINALFKGIRGIHPSPIISTLDGKYLITPIFDKTGFPSGKGVMLFEVTD